MGEVIGDSPLGENPPEFWCRLFSPRAEIEAPREVPRVETPKEETTTPKPPTQ